MAADSPCRRPTRSSSRSSSLMAIATYIIPAGALQLNEDGEPIPGTYEQVEQNPQRIVTDSLMAPINGLYGIESAEDGSISVWNSGELFGAIDVALFILVIGGFLGVTMKTGAIQGGIAQIVVEPARPRAPADPDPDDRVRDRGHDLRDGGGEPGVLRARHHGDDRRGLRRARRRFDPAARLRDRGARLDDQPVRHGHRIRLRRRPRSTRASSAASSSSSSAPRSASGSSCATPRASRPIRAPRSSRTSGRRTRRAS